MMGLMAEFILQLPAKSLGFHLSDLVFRLESNIHHTLQMMGKVKLCYLLTSLLNIYVFM